MKIYTRAEFLKLPEGTIFAKGKPWFFDTLSVKGETCPYDFLCRELVNIESSGSDQRVDRLDEMLEAGASYPIEDAYGRDGCFDDDDLFLVYEKADLEELRNVINVALEVVE